MDRYRCGRLRLRWVDGSCILLLNGFDARGCYLSISWLQRKALLPQLKTSIYVWTHGKLYDIHGDVGASLQHRLHSLSSSSNQLIQYHKP